jgi:hypothetical protein
MSTQLSTQLSTQSILRLFLSFKIHFKKVYILLLIALRGQLPAGRKKTPQRA